jgi:hypothetical protein
MDLMIINRFVAVTGGVGRDPFDLARRRKVVPE